MDKLALVQDPSRLSALLEIQREGCSLRLARDSSSGCGRQNSEAEWPISPAGRSVIRLT